MASHYKIRKSQLKEFFGLFTKKRTPEKLQKLIDKDPVLQKLKADVDKLNYKYKPEIDKLKIILPIISVINPTITDSINNFNININKKIYFY